MGGRWELYHISSLKCILLSRILHVFSCKIVILFAYLRLKSHGGSVYRLQNAANDTSHYVTISGGVRGGEGCRERLDAVGVSSIAARNFLFVKELVREKKQRQFRKLSIIITLRFTLGELLWITPHNDFVSKLQKLNFTL